MSKKTILTLLEIARYIIGAIIGWLSCVSAHAIGVLP